MNIKTVQKSFAQAFVLLSFLFLIAACSKSDDNSPSPDPDPDPEPETEDVWVVYMKGSDSSSITIEVIEYGHKRFCYEDDECISVLDDLESSYTANANEEIEIVASEEGKVPVSVRLNNLNIIEGDGVMRLAKGKYVTVDGEKTFEETKTLMKSPELTEGYIYSFKYN